MTPASGLATAAPAAPPRTRPLRAAPAPMPVRRTEPLRAQPLPAPPIELRAPDGEPLPLPPMPPFARTADGWEALLPGRLGRKVRVGVTATGLVLGEAHVPWDDVAHATVDLGRSDDQGVCVSYAVRTGDGRVAKVRTSSLSARNGDPLYDVADFVWEVLRTVVSPRLRAALVATVADGGLVELAGLRLSQQGMAARRRPDHVVPWRQVGDPWVDRRMIAVPAGVKLVTTPVASEDAVLLLDLLPQLRAAAVRGQLG